MNTTTTTTDTTNTTDTTTTNTMNIMNTTNNLILTAIMAAFDTAVDAAVLRAITPLTVRIEELEAINGSGRDTVEIRELKDYIRDSIGDALDAYDFSDVVQARVESSTERMIAQLDDRLDLAINEHDFSDEVKEAVESAIQDHDFESQIESALDNYDFSSAMDTALENHDFGSEIEEKVTEMIDEALESLSITRG